MWYYLEGEQNRGPYTAAQMQEFLQQRTITGYTNVWREGLPAWVSLQDSELAHLLAAAPVSVVPQADPRLQNPYWTEYGGDQPAVATATLQSHQYQYSSPETLKTTLLILAGILAIISVAAIVTFYEQIELLTKLENGVIMNEQQALLDLDSLNTRLAQIGLGQLGLTIILGIVFLIWTYRVNANTWAFGARGMTITPGWAVGWYFVPFMNLVRPYQAMQETWKASTSPGDWQNQSGSVLIGFWWFMRIISAILAWVGIQHTNAAKDISSAISALNINLIAEFFDFLPLIAVTLMIVRITNKQTALALNAQMTTGERDYLR